MTNNMETKDVKNLWRSYNLEGLLDTCLRVTRDLKGKGFPEIPKLSPDEMTLVAKQCQNLKETFAIFEEGKTKLYAFLDTQDKDLQCLEYLGNRQNEIDKLEKTVRLCLPSALEYLKSHIAIQSTDSSLAETSSLNVPSLVNETSLLSVGSPSHPRMRYGSGRGVRRNKSPVASVNNASTRRRTSGGSRSGVSESE